MSINVRQPAIVLMNPENAGSLLATPMTAAAQQLAAYWRKRATVYVMGRCLVDDLIRRSIVKPSSRSRRVFLSTRERWSEQQLNEFIDEHP